MNPIMMAVRQWVVAILSVPTRTPTEAEFAHASDKRVRHIVSRFARGNLSLARGSFMTQRAANAERERILAIDFDALR